MGKGKHKNREKLSREQAAALVMGVFGRNPKKILNFKQVSSQLFMTDKYRRAVIGNTLDELVRNKQLEQVEPGRYRLLSRAGYRTGKLDMTQHGYAFLVTDDQEEDVFIARNNLKTALD
jgi:ribonuclease R